MSTLTHLPYLDVAIVAAVVALFAIEIAYIELFEVKRWRHKDNTPDIMKRSSW